MLRRLTPLEFEQAFLGRSQALELDPDIEKAVRAILNEVRQYGDNALVRFTQRYDGVTLDAGRLAVGREELEAAVEGLSPQMSQALQVSLKNLREFHSLELPRDWHTVRPDGTVVAQRVRPVDRVGLYVPGGRAVYPSSVLMNVVPAQTAGVRDIIVCTPPGPDGRPNQVVLAAAALAGVERVYRVGGAQAIAALAFGTESIPAVDMIAGPGNIYVTVAKRLVYGLVRLDSLAGPSELAVLCDESADAAVVASDLLAQAEHDPDARVFLFATSSTVADRVSEELQKQIKSLERKAIIRQAIETSGAAVVGPEVELLRAVNALAPEHLSLQVADATAALGLVRHAGAIFVGSRSAVCFGDYTAGPNHVLPTGRTARFSSPLGVESFVKRSNVLYVSGEGMTALAEPTMELARAEGLTAHARAVEVRLERLGVASADGEGSRP